MESQGMGEWTFQPACHRQVYLPKADVKLRRMFYYLNDSKSGKKRPDVGMLREWLERLGNVHRTFQRQGQKNLYNP